MMKSATTAIAAVSLLLAGASAVAAQQIDAPCAGPAARAGVATTHNVIFNATDNVCIATLLGNPMFGTPGFVGVAGAGAGAGAAGAGAAGALGAAGGVLAGVIAITVAATGSTGGT